MGLFSRKDWNVVAVIFERKDLAQISGQRAKGGAATKARDGAKGHPRTILWAVFDQKGSIVESGLGQGASNVPKEAVNRLQRELPFHKTVQDVLKSLETGAEEKLARPLPLGGPAKPS